MLPSLCRVLLFPQQNSSIFFKVDRHEQANVLIVFSRTESALMLDDMTFYSPNSTMSPAKKQPVTCASLKSISPTS